MLESLTHLLSDDRYSLVDVLGLTFASFLFWWWADWRTEGLKGRGPVAVSREDEVYEYVYSGSKGGVYVHVYPRKKGEEDTRLWRRRRILMISAWKTNILMYQIIRYAPSSHYIYEIRSTYDRSPQSTIPSSTVPWPYSNIIIVVVVSLFDSHQISSNNHQNKKQIRVDMDSSTDRKCK